MTARTNARGGNPTAVLSGCLEASIDRVLQDLAGELPPFEAALVRCVDSCRPEDLAQLFGRRGIEVEPGFPGVCLPPGILFRERERGLFNGFDKVWLASRAGAARLPAGTRGLTSDVLRLGCGLPEDLRAAMEAAGAILALGDGVGLNYLTPDASLAGRLRSLYGVRTVPQ